MKNILFYIPIIYCMLAGGQAQSQNFPCVNGVTTNPDNTNWSAPVYDQLYKKNTGTNFFDWRQQTFQVSFPNTNFWFNEVTSPFYIFGKDAYNEINLGPNSDFQPADGWELVKRDFGYRSDGTVKGGPSVGPYLVLYNKYSGKLRVIGWFSSQNGTFPTLRVQIAFPVNQNVSAVFSNNSAVAQPLDHSTDILNISSCASFGSEPSFPFFADFQLAYDPCTCFNPSNLNFTFSALLNAQIKLYGRLLGTNTPLEEVVADIQNKSGDVEMKDFLTSVTESNTESNLASAGLITYRNIDKLVEDYKSESGGTNGETTKRTLEVLHAGLEAAALFVPEITVPAVAGSTAAQISASVAANAVATEAKEKAEMFKSGLEKAAGLTDFASILLGNEGENKTWPSVVKGEMSIAGTMAIDANQGGSDFTIANPGSLNSASVPEWPTYSNNVSYPLYNEVLGTFALLTTPTVNHYVNIFGTGYPTGLTHPSSTLGSGRRDEYQLTGNLQYIFNPVINVDESRTRIVGALVIETDNGSTTQMGQPIYCYGHNIDTAYTTTGKRVYITDFLPLECLTTRIPLIERQTKTYPGMPESPMSNLPPYKVYLKLIITMVSKNTSSTGYPNSSVYVIKYPVTINEMTGRLSTIPLTLGTVDKPNYGLVGNLNFTGDTYTSDSTYYGWYVHMTGSNSTGTHLNKSTGKYVMSNVHIVAGDSILIDGEGSIAGEFVLETNEVPVVQCGSPYGQQSSTTVKAFCTGTQYQARKASSKSASTYVSTQGQIGNTKKPEVLTLDVIPNPFTEHATLRYTLPQGDHVNITITDLLGEEVRTLENSYRTSGTYETDLQRLELEAGVYLCTIRTSRSTVTKRVVILK